MTKRFILLVGLVCFVVGAAGLLLTVKQTAENGGAPANLDMTRTIAAAEVTGLDIRTDIANITFAAGTGDQIQAHLSGYVSEANKKDWMLDATKGADGTWNVTAGTRKRIRIGIPISELIDWIGSRGASKPQLEITLPKKAYDRINAKSDVGNIRLGELQAGTLEVRTSTGNIALDAFQGKKLEMTTDTGNLDLNNAAGEMVLVSDTGNMRAVVQQLTAPITMSTDTGNLHLEFAGVPSSAAFDLKSDVGRTALNVPNVSYEVKEKHHISGTIGSGSPLVKLRSDTGNLEVAAR